MTDTPATRPGTPPKTPEEHLFEDTKLHLFRRYAAERRFRLYGQIAIMVALGMLGVMLFTIVGNGWKGFLQTYVALDVYLDPAKIDPAGARDEAKLRSADYLPLIKDALDEAVPGVTERAERRLLTGFLRNNPTVPVRDFVLENPHLIGTTQRIWIATSDDIDVFAKGGYDRAMPEGDRRIKDIEIAWYDMLWNAGRIEVRFSDVLFSAGDSREPENAGLLGAIMGSVLTLFVCLVITLPIGVLAAIYLEEFAPKNRISDFIEVNINNLAAVPSIVFGLLGLAIFLQFFGMPRSAPVVGGTVLALLVLPTIIISARAALKAVPPSIREAARGVGASELQVVTHHVLPLAMPGIMTGTIIGMAHALGETAPLLMIGMVAFIVNVPEGFTDSATVLPVQIFLWSDSPERAFVAKTSAAIMVLLGFLILMNLAAIMIRRRFERRW